ncbi:hypothetical protein [Streptomyces sp. STCH 565 A]|uniref:hypothetical protein n=1 Tax=Streptomyces sp. STCH 565 A TaxID=2950532 RepID=UPI002074E744|nr:hypothetical protein [Streptomyces sp. STCH 565 A]MCM8555336.1 hypothetical protein [Streptomyces sp. STCH 565 A]
MQQHPVYTVVGSASGERMVVAEYRVEIGPGGGLDGMLTGDAVARVLMGAMRAAGATTVTATRQDLASSAITSDGEA